MTLIIMCCQAAPRPYPQAYVKNLRLKSQRKYLENRRSKRCARIAKNAETALTRNTGSTTTKATVGWSDDPT